ncbi:hypothetical protein R69776_06384 [Paraburkholderia nemoris]|uniref:Uncharacterized protein n=1 Tax=Paraburkholderia nemoris TaxID=2793076 RepID=A0ABN7MS68_9BURK|nr:hypothetical protein R75777_05977 [Paraburkholderia nemoris]CAE6826215.1 hypothetical protein R69776_06384 [Paraburkholderia nemoris]
MDCQIGDTRRVCEFQECRPGELLQDNVLRLFWNVVPRKPCHADLAGNPM